MSAPYVQPIPFNWDALIIGLAPILDLAAGLPIAAAQTRLGIGGTAQNEDSSIYFPQNDGSGDPGTQNTLAKITFDLLSARSVGTDEKRSGYDPTIVIPGDTYVPPQPWPAQLGGIVRSVVGNRLLTISITCECWDLTGSGAAQYLERVRINLRLPSYRAELSKLKVAISAMTQLRPMKYFDDNGRAVSAATFDLLLNAADAANDEPITTIERMSRPRFVPIT